MRIAAGIMTCNEERTIRPLLDALRTAKADNYRIEQIVVVSAACRDRTDEIVREAAAADPRVELISEPERRGKSAAANTFFAARRPSDLTLLASGDICPESGAIDKLVSVFADPQAGMAGGRPVPVNSHERLTGRMAALMWDMHHDIALKSPKLGEMVMFRSSLVGTIPKESPVDEASLEAAILESGHVLRYVPDAIIHNRGPDSLREWLSQRRRIAYGHAWLRQHSGHTVSTGGHSSVFRLLAGHVARRPDYLPAAVALMGFEALARLLAKKDFAQGKQHTIWDIATSTKSLESTSSNKRYPDGI